MHFEMCTHRVHKMLKPDKKIDYIDMHMYSDRKHLLMCVSMYQCTENCLSLRMEYIVHASRTMACLDRRNCNVQSVADPSGKKIKSLTQFFACSHDSQHLSLVLNRITPTLR